MSENLKIPHHVAIIMDGNGRWASLHGKERVEGHIVGAERLRDTVIGAAKFGIKYLTVYAFSAENWGRPAEEVNAIMELFCRNVISQTPELQQQGVKVLVIGDRTRFSDKVRSFIDRIEKDTSAGERLTLILAFNYSARNEITEAVRKIAAKAMAGEINADDITPQTIGENLLTAGIPDPDLLIRTSGEYRLSNFLLWQSAYTEFYFTDILWPDFNEDELYKAIQEYSRRDRRYGLVAGKQH